MSWPCTRTSASGSSLGVPGGAAGSRPSGGGRPPTRRWRRSKPNGRRISASPGCGGCKRRSQTSARSRTSEAEAGPSLERVTGIQPAWPADDKGKETIPFPLQRIAHRGTCGKTRVAPQNRRLRPGHSETGVATCVCCCRRMGQAGASNR
jgi:hypothetical protein